MKTTIAIVGETNVNRTDPETAFVNASAFLKDADFRLGHMETLLSNAPSQNPNHPDIPYKPLWRFSTPDNVRAWQSYSFDAVSLASNITYSNEAIHTTISALDDSGIAHSGIGDNIDAALMPAIVEKGGVRIGLLSYTSVFWPFLVPAGTDKPGAAVLPAQSQIIPSKRSLEMPGALPDVITHATDDAKLTLSNAIHALKTKADVIAVSCHWGVSGSDATCTYQQELAHLAIDCGADIVMGHHPHHMQGIEIYHGRPIFYSMGNFAFDWFQMHDRNKQGFGARITLKDGDITVALQLFERDASNQVSPVSPSEPSGQSMLANIKSLSEQYGTEFTVVGDEIYVMRVHTDENN